jgi:BAH domain
MKLQVFWFYRPEEAAGGRKMFHGSRELFRSTHQDDIDAGTIRKKCQVLTLESYQALPRPVKEDVYFSRVFYLASTQKFKPSRWATFCTCKMPYNPDLDMVQCSFCKDYFHVHCLQSAGHLPPGPPPNIFDCHQCKIGWKEPAATAP